MTFRSLMLRLALAVLPLAGLPSASGQAADSGPFIVEVQDVTAHVGEHAVMHVTLRLQPGFRLLESYTNRVSRFSSWNGGVTFDRPVVRGVVHDDTLVFAVGVTPTAAGRHPINGVFRVGYIEDPDRMSMVSVPLMANVIGAP